MVVPVLLVLPGRIGKPDTCSRAGPTNPLPLDVVTGQCSGPAGPQVLGSVQIYLMRTCIRPRMPSDSQAHDVPEAPGLGLRAPGWLDLFPPAPLAQLCFFTATGVTGPNWDAQGLMSRRDENILDFGTPNLSSTVYTQCFR